MKTTDEAEINRHITNFSVAERYSVIGTKAVAKRLLETEFVFCNGDMRDIRVKHLGLGVYKVYTEQRPL